MAKLLQGTFLKLNLIALNFNKASNHQVHAYYNTDYIKSYWTFLLNQHLKKISFFLFFEKETNFSIINKLKVQDSYTSRIIERPRNGKKREREDQ